VRILIADDDDAIRSALRRALRLEGWSVDEAADGAEALAAARRGSPDAIVLDWMMPGVDGIGVLRALRDAGDRTPVLMLTARDGTASRVDGLDAGADDYLGKPFALDELTARLRALLRRLGPESGREVLRYDDLELDTGTFEARRDGRLLELTRIEHALLELLLRNARRVLTREVILDRVWGTAHMPFSNSLEVYVSHLRRKTEEGGAGRLVHTVRGVGYVLRGPSS
jgi:two-component system, OmpR family, response regulator MprA